jgi:hypothetical protein
MKMEETANNITIEFLERNSFKRVADNKYANIACVITILEDCYQIQFTNFDGDWEFFTQSLHIPSLVGTLTWNNLLDRNYAK